MRAAFIEILKLIVDEGDYGTKQYDKDLIKARLPYGKDRYITAPFTCDPQHLRDALKTVDILPFVEEGAREAGEHEFCPPGQLAVELPTHYSKLKFKREEAYGYKSEFWMQASNRESPIHVDHGRVVSFVQLDVEDNRQGVLVQRPGDVVVLNNLVFHSVLLVYQPITAAIDKWGAVFGDVVVCEQDRWASFRVVEDGDYNSEDYEEAKKKFMAKLQLPEKSEKAYVGAAAKKDKKRKMQERWRSLS
ncbi:uncharacterized protein IUM83_10437 [Phytophthora cinnamomi]|uniref:uncharacterized protein n=1 Tax=Phytophthora cinnamomi TaxID=4785 RepID=UPI00355A78B8|nr:hypothetical protein IUM83_10437 [Phytophthora cinnamomi]